MYSKKGFIMIADSYFRTLLLLVSVLAGGLLTYWWYEDARPITGTVNPSNNGVENGLDKAANEIAGW